MEKFLLILLMIAVILIITGIQLYMNLDKHRFRLQQQWKHMQPGVVKWVDNSAALKDRMELTDGETAELEQDIERYRRNPKKVYEQLAAVNGMREKLQERLGPESYSDPVLETLLEARSDIESELHDSVTAFNLSVATINKRIASTFFQPVCKLCRFSRVEELKIGGE